MVRRHLNFTIDQWLELPQWQCDYYWDKLLDELLPDPDSPEGWDDWGDDPNVVHGR